MRVFEGCSGNPDVYLAVEEAVGQWQSNYTNITPDIIFVFHAIHQDSSQLAVELSARFPDSLIVGASTAAVWTTRQYRSRSLQLLAICSSDIRWSVAVVEHVDQFDAAQAELLRDQLLTPLQLQPHGLSRSRHFCLSFFDGLCQCEERVIAAVNQVLAPITLLGGSASDNWTFEHTYVMANGHTYQNAAVFVLADSDLPFKAIKHQHFIAGEVNTVVTRVDDNGRRVLHLDGMPAAQRYASLIGAKGEALNEKHFFKHPLMYRFAGEGYIRTIGQALEDGSLQFYTPVEAGMVLNLCQRQDMAQSFAAFTDAAGQSFQSIQLLLGFHCRLCSIEAETLGIEQELSQYLAGIAEHVGGFDSYGEQWQGLHINQTFVALALGGKHD